MNVKQVCQEELERRIHSIEEALKLSKIYIEDDDFLQAAVRLQELEQLIYFNEFTLRLFESV